MKYVQSTEYVTVFDEEKKLWVIRQTDDPDFVVCYATDKVNADLMIDALTTWTILNELHQHQVKKFHSRQPEERPKCNAPICPTCRGKFVVTFVEYVNPNLTQWRCTGCNQSVYMKIKKG